MSSGLRLTGVVAVQTYTFDSLNRINDAVESVTPTGGSASQSWEQTFTYDRYGNRRIDEANTSMPASSSNPAVSSPTISTTTNRLASSGYTYDNAGNTTADTGGQSYTYDAENKMVTASDGSSTLGEYYYDGDGNRIKKVVPSTKSKKSQRIEHASSKTSRGIRGKSLPSSP